VKPEALLIALLALAIGAVIAMPIQIALVNLLRGDWKSERVQRVAAPIGLWLRRDRPKWAILYKGQIPAIPSPLGLRRRLSSEGRWLVQDQNGVLLPFPAVYATLPQVSQDQIRNLRYRWEQSERLTGAVLAATILAAALLHSLWSIVVLVVGLVFAR